MSSIIQSYKLHQANEQKAPAPVTNNSDQELQGIDQPKVSQKKIADLLKIDLKDTTKIETKISNTLAKPLELFGNATQLKSPAAIFDSLDLKSNAAANNGVSIIEPGVRKATINAVNTVQGQHWIGNVASNGNREAAVIIPEGADFNKPFEIIYYLHGHNGTISSSLTNSSTGFGDELNKMAKDPNRNFIYVGVQGPPKEANGNWMNPKSGESFGDFQNFIENTIKTKLDARVQIGSSTLKVHSGGGWSAARAAEEGKADIDRIDFFDASYGAWAKSAYEGFINKNPNLEFNVFYIPGSKTDSGAKAVNNKKNVMLIDAGTYHGKVPDKFMSFTRPQPQGGNINVQLVPLG